MVSFLCRTIMVSMTAYLLSLRLLRERVNHLRLVGGFCLPSLAALYGLHVVVDVLDTTPKSIQPSVSFTAFEGKGRTA